MFRPRYLPAILLFSTAAIAGNVFTVFASVQKPEQKSGPLSTQQIVIDFDACINKLLSREKPVYQADPVTLNRDCPELLPHLADPALEHISPPLEDQTTFSQLYDVVRILKSKQRARAANNWRLDQAVLKNLLDEVYEAKKEPEKIKNFVEIFWEWAAKKLRGYFDEDNWFTRTFDFKIKPSGELFSGLKNLFIVIIVVMILYIVINELYAANIRQYFSRRKTAKASIQEQLETGRSGTTVTGLNDILQLPLQHQVPALLRYSLRILIKKGVIPNKYSLTNQEFLQIAKTRVPEISNDLAMIISSSDKVLYGRKSITASDAGLLFENIKNLESVNSMDKT